VDGARVVAARTSVSKHGVFAAACAQHPLLQVRRFDGTSRGDSGHACPRIQALPCHERAGQRSSSHLEWWQAPGLTSDLFHTAEEIIGSAAHLKPLTCEFASVATAEQPLRWMISGRAETALTCENIGGRYWD
jgi:hypothetical protein